MLSIPRAGLVKERGTEQAEYHSHTPVATDCVRISRQGTAKWILLREKMHGIFVVCRKCQVEMGEEISFLMSSPSKRTKSF